MNGGGNIKQTEQSIPESYILAKAQPCCAQYWSRLPRLLDNSLVLNMKMTVYLFISRI